MECLSNNRLLQQKQAEEIVTQLKICRSLETVKQVHAKAMEMENDSCHFVANTLVFVYAKCRSMADARRVFDSITQPGVVSWNALLLGYAENGEGLTALNLFARMKSEGCTPNSRTFVAAVKACSSLAVDEAARAQCREWGRQLHSEVGLHCNIYVQNTLIDMYAKCGSMAEARAVFQEIKQPNVVSWTALIMGYVDNDEGVTALKLFARMKAAPNSVTFVAVLKAYASLAAGQHGARLRELLEQGKRIHSEIGSHSDAYVQSTLILMYSKCRDMVEARRVFDDIKRPDLVSWNTIILGYAENGEGNTALDLFVKMRFKGPAPNGITFVAALKACVTLAVEQGESGRAECLEKGQQIHSEIGNHSNLFVKNALIDMYSKSGSIDKARQVFDTLTKPDVVSWTALILGYAENGQCVTALDQFARMKSQSCAPDCITFVAALKACGSLGALESGRKIHAEIDSGTQRDAILITCLVDFYAKCGSMVEAQNVFDSYPDMRDLTTWTALLSGYSHLGDEKAVLRLFEDLQIAGLKPNGVTFLCVLSCCNHAGLVDKASEFFDEMPTKYGVTRNFEHYNCMVDLLGRSNKLEDAMALLRSMPWKPNTVTWVTVLDACRKWKNVPVGSLAFSASVSLNDAGRAAYVLMAYIYKSRGMRKEQELVLQMRNQIELRREAEQSCWTNGRNEVHMFRM